MSLSSRLMLTRMYGGPGVPLMLKKGATEMCLYYYVVMCVVLCSVMYVLRSAMYKSYEV